MLLPKSSTFLHTHTLTHSQIENLITYLELRGLTRQIRRESERTTDQRVLNTFVLQMNKNHINESRQSCTLNLSENHLPIARCS